MLRKIIHIDPDKCNGCGLCAEACHEGAIGMVEGKAKLLRDDYCDGLGNCLPVCPTGAIRFEEREAAPYNEAQVKAHMAQKAQKVPEKPEKPLACGCPGTMAQALKPAAPAATPPVPAAAEADTASRLAQWPVQIRLVPVQAPYFSGAHLLIAADCAAYAHGDFHKRFMRNRVTLIACPKLDEVDYAEKLTAILAENDIRSVTLVRMEVPCCGGLEKALKTAMQQSGKWIPWQVVTLGCNGQEKEC